METLFSNPPIKYSRWLDKKGKEIAYVVMEDEGDYYSILTSDSEGNAIQTSIDKNILHPCPAEYANSAYLSTVRMVNSFIKNGNKAVTFNYK